MQYTYTTLLASCQNYCIDNSTEYTTEFPNIVQLAEMRIIKDLNLSVFDTVTTGTMLSTVATITKPTDLIAIQDLFVVVAGAKIYLQERSKSYLDNYWPNSTLTDQPIYYAEDTTTTWQLAPIPDGNYSYQVNYIARPIPMSSTNNTTWIGDKLGEVLLYATLIGSTSFFQEDPATQSGMIALWEKSYAAAVTQAHNELSPLISAKDDTLIKLTNTQQ